MSKAALRQFFLGFTVTTFYRAAPWLALALTLAAAPALAASGPPAGFVLTSNADLAFTSPDGATRLEQYMKDRRPFRRQMAGLGAAGRSDDGAEA